MKALYLALFAFVLVGCASQQEKEAERIFMEARVLEARGEYAPIRDARNSYLQIVRENPKSKWAERSRERLQLTHQRWTEMEKAWLANETAKIRAEYNAANPPRMRLP